jgi:hypothetical protein
VPEVVSVPRGRGAKVQKKIGKLLGAGTYNAVYELPTSPAVLPTGALHPLDQDPPQVLRASLPTFAEADEVMTPLLGRSLTNRVIGLLGPFIDVETMCQ